MVLGRMTLNRITVMRMTLGKVTKLLESRSTCFNLFIQMKLKLNEKNMTATDFTLLVNSIKYLHLYLTVVGKNTQWMSPNDYSCKLQL